MSKETYFLLSGFLTDETNSLGEQYDNYRINADTYLFRISEIEKAQKELDELYSKQWKNGPKYTPN